MTAVIPVRLGSTRFPGKALYSYRGKPLLYYVWRSVSESRLVDRLVIATDNQKIAKSARSFGAEVVMTKSTHATGSDRTAEVARKIGGDIIINVQGDTFGELSRAVTTVVSAMKKDKSIECATLIRKLGSENELQSLHTVKAVVSDSQHALWFSRLPLPHVRDKRKSGITSYWAHIGVYFFRPRTLSAFSTWRQSRAELAESLEQLRLLEHRVPIRVFKTTAPIVSIDTVADINKIAKAYKGRVWQNL